MTKTTQAASKKAVLDTPKDVENTENVEDTPNIDDTEQREIDVDNAIEALLLRIENLENAISKIATLSGSGNYLKEFGFTAWVPGKKDMRKNRG